MSTDVTPKTRPLSARAAEEIRALMGRRDINKSELARRLGVSDMWVGRRLRGDLPLALDDLERIASALGVSVDDLIPRTGTAQVTLPHPTGPKSRPGTGHPHGHPQGSKRPGEPRRPSRLTPVAA